MSKAKKGDTVQVHYSGTFNDGEQFDSSFERGEPISFTVGAGQMIPGFDASVEGMEIGETKEISLDPDEAYGSHNPQAIQDIEKSVIPEEFEFSVGLQVQGQTGDGRPLIGVILSEQESTVTLDFNHPMAGKELNFKLELVGIENKG